MSDWKNVQYKDGKMRTSEGGGGGGSSTFAGLDDVSFNNLQNGQVPKYNSTTQKWENANESGGGGTVTYSTTEQVIGTWIDGKPVYEITYDLQSVITLTSSYSHSGIVISAIKKIISIVSAIDANGQSVQLVVGLYSNNELAVAFAGGPNNDLKSFTIQYTKTTD